MRIVKSREERSAACSSCGLAGRSCQQYKSTVILTAIIGRAIVLIGIWPYHTAELTARYARSYATVVPNVMPTPLNTLCSASRSHFRARSKNAHVWISDGLLADTFNAFVRNHTRRGSNVPGPLEARRRSTKRKLTSLGHSAVANHSFDPAGLFGFPSQAEWWKPPVPMDQAQQQPVFFWPLPAWTPSPEPESQTRVPSTIVQTGREERIARSAERPRTSDEVLSKRLLGMQVKTLEALMGVLEELNVDLARKPHLARRILNNMTKKKWPWEEIAAYLLDPRTNPAGSGNHAHLFTHWRSHTALLNWLVKREVVQRAAGLGLLGVDDLGEIVLLAYEIHPTIFPGNSRAAFGYALLGAIESSKVLSLMDLEDQCRQEWLGLVRNQPFEASTPQLLWRLWGVSIIDDGLRLQKVVSDSLKTINRSSIHLLSHLVDFLLTMPQDLLHHTIFRCTWGLRHSLIREHADSKPVDGPRLPTSLARPGWSLDTRPLDQADNNTPLSTNEPSDDHKVDKPNEIDMWYEVLASLGTAMPDSFILRQSGLKEWVNDGRADGRADQDSRERLVVGLWVLMANTAGNSELNTARRSKYQKRALARLIREQFSADCDERREDILVSILDILRNTSLPKRSKLIKRLKTLTGGFIHAKTSYEGLQEQLASLRARDLPKLSLHLFYISTRFHFPHLLVSVAQSVNKDLARFEQICCEIIRDMPGSLTLVLRLLFHNRELKFALGRAASGMAEDPASSRQVNRASPTDHALGGYTYAQIVGMIEHFAEEYATSTALSDRNAFRKVFWLHMYVQMHCGPLTPRIRRALWHAAAVRPAKPAYCVVKFVYDIVVDWEGLDVAQKLLYSSARQAARDEACRAAETTKLERLLLEGASQEDESEWSESYRMAGLQPVEADLEADLGDDRGFGGDKLHLSRAIDQDRGQLSF